jgi:hypothetical protein
MAANSTLLCIHRDPGQLSLLQNSVRFRASGIRQFPDALHRPKPSAYYRDAVPSLEAALFNLPSESTVLIQSEDMLHGRIGTQSQLLSIPLPYRLDRSISRQVALSTGMEGVHT